MGRPFSQHDEVAGALFEACDIAPGLRAPVGAPVAEPPGLSDGAFAPIGDCALFVVVWPPLTSNCKAENRKDFSRMNGTGKKCK